MPSGAPIHVVVGVDRLVSPRVGYTEQVAVRVAGESGRSVERTENLAKDFTEKLVLCPRNSGRVGLKGSFRRAKSGPLFPLFFL